MWLCLDSDSSVIKYQCIFMLLSVLFYHSYLIIFFLVFFSHHIIPHFPSLVRSHSNKCPHHLYLNKTNTFIRRRTREEPSSIYRTSDFSVKGLCVMTEIEGVRPDVQSWRPYSFEYLGAMELLNFVCECELYIALYLESDKESWDCHKSKSQSGATVR